MGGLVRVRLFRAGRDDRIQHGRPRSGSQSVCDVSAHIAIKSSIRSRPRARLPRTILPCWSNGRDAREFTVAAMHDAGRGGDFGGRHA